MPLKILIIGFVWPEPQSSAAGGRMLQLIRLFQEQDWEVVFASAAMDSDFMYDLESIGIQRQKILLNDSSFDFFIKECNPEIVLFDRFMIEEQFGWRVAENCPDALRILDTEDLHCLQQARQLAFKETRQFAEADLFSDVAKREAASIFRCDISLIISEFEMDLLQKTFKIDASLLYYLPFLLEPINESIIQRWPSFGERNDFVFIGNFLHEPNWNAVQYLKEAIWPLIRKRLPEAQLHIYGAYPSQKVLQLHQPLSGFHVMGRAGDADEIVRKAKVVLAPLRFGAGIKGKLVEAMQCGTPSVTTSIGAEAMEIDGEWNGFICDNPEDFANAAVALYSDKLLWQKACESGISIFNRRYLKSNFEVPFIKHIISLQKALISHRLNNFTGAMLMHHTLNSTKYMSRWIEEKNK
ncbi:glycosyltransferase [Flavobacterium sp. 3HN19-14]|uniref:glycosyltransferase n=1 Tax=Flavobacterium sp. 3HN19-14 TaxID=3448133 RepID=UPI003EE1186E